MRFSGDGLAAVLSLLAGVSMFVFGDKIAARVESRRNGTSKNSHLILLLLLQAAGIFVAAMGSTLCMLTYGFTTTLLLVAGAVLVVSAVWAQWTKVTEK